MDPRRPRHSVLTLFDPLLGSPKVSLDKENNVGDSSFFRPLRTTVLPQPAPTFKRRLIDVGDITIDEPDIAELLAENDKFNDHFNFDIPGDDDNDTLTFRDIAKAATPKWSGKQITSLTTPKSSPTPRTPLAQISLKDETTPIARKKPLKHQPLTTTSKLSQVELAEPCIVIVSTPQSPPNLNDSVQIPSFPSISTPIIEVSLDTSPTSITSETSSGSSETLASSLNIPQSSGSLIADTSNPSLMSPSSSGSQSSLELPRLRPYTSPADQSHRHSVDLQSSFRLQLNSDTTFDLLNEKISFLGSRDGTDSFLKNLELDDSFGEDGFDEILENSKKNHVSDADANLPLSCEKDSKLNQESQTFLPLDQVKPFSKKEGVAVQIKSDLKHTGVQQNTPNRKFSKAHPHSLDQSPREVHMVDKIDAALSTLPRGTGMISTPRSSSGLQVPPLPVPALKIVKRSRLLTQPSATITHSRRTSMSTTAPIPTRRDNTRSPTSKLTAIVNENAQTDVPQLRGVKRTNPIQPPLASSLVDGPRRVKISEGPKLDHASNTRTTVQTERAKSSYTSISNGPRRIAVAAPNAGKPPGAVTGPSTQLNSGLKPPVKYGTVGSMSAIPKPVSRIGGSNIPALPSSRTLTRIGAPSRGVPGR